MEVGTGTKMRQAYYFSWPDDEILDERTLGLSSDDDTWLYKIEQPGFNGYYHQASQQNHQLPSGTVAVDSRTFTRRKHSYQRPSLESVIESPFSNRSSLGILSTTKLNDTMLMNSITPLPVNQEKISSNFIVSDKKPFAPRAFRLESPLLNSPITVSQFPDICSVERKRQDSELSDISFPLSLQNSSPFDKNEVLTDSLINFLEKQNNTCPPPMNFQDDKPMTESLVSLPETEDNFDIKDEAMTESFVNFLAPVDCKPPRGFEDNEMCSSIVNIDEKDVLPGFDMPNSLIEYLDDVKVKSTPVLDNALSNEAENIPPEYCVDVIRDNSKQVDRLKIEVKPNSTFDIEKDEDSVVEDDLDISPNITFTNNVNITKTKKDICVKDELNITKSRNTTFEKESSIPIDNVELNLKMRALNNRDLNVNRNLNDSDYDLNTTKTKVSTNSTRLNGTFTKSDLNLSRLSNNTKSYGTYKKSDLNGTFDLSHQIPMRNSTFNTTFTKLDISSKELSPSRLPTYTKSSERLNGMEDDQNSSASDSSFSSGSTKPRSVDELRTIAQQQESSLVQASSTPTGETVDTSSRLTQLDLELSPIRRLSLGAGRNSESRSAHCSPVRSPHPRTPLPHPISRLQQTQAVEMRRQTLQASSLSNLAKPRESGLRMPLPVNRMAMISKPELRPLKTLPQATPQTAIPRPQTSRLPMPRFRTSGIPTMKRGGQH